MIFLNISTYVKVTISKKLSNKLIIRRIMEIRHIKDKSNCLEYPQKYASVSSSSYSTKRVWHSSDVSLCQVLTAHCTWSSFSIFTLAVLNLKDSLHLESFVTVCLFTMAFNSHIHQELSLPLNSTKKATLPCVHWDSVQSYCH